MGIVIGQAENGSLKLNIDRLIETRLLIQANSGGGKSWLIRKLMEVSHGKVQQILLDMEGEFGTLREKFDYILAGKDGDIPANPKTAEILARKVLELNASIIIDLYELKHHDRIKFARLFLESMINAPKELWHPCLVVIDEAHVFCPEKGESEAMGAVIDLATRGRKRGFCAVLATQRLSKLHKDVAAETLNKVIGRTGLDIDMKRASEELGFTSKQDMLALRDLEPGEFYAFGPAMSKQVVKVKIGEIETEHPKSGKRSKVHIPLPTAKIKQILSKFTDLPKEAEKELQDKQSMMAKIKELEYKLRTMQQPKQEIDQAKFKEILAKEYRLGEHDAHERSKVSFSETKKIVLEKLNKVLKEIEQSLHYVSGNQDKNSIKEEFNLSKHVQMLERTLFNNSIPNAKKIEANADIISDGIQYGKAEKLILQFLLLQPEKSFTQQQVAVMVGYATSGTFNTYMSKLSSAGLIKRDNGMVNLLNQKEALIIAGDMPARKDAMEEWLNRLGGGPKRIYEVLLSNPHQEYTVAEIAEAVSMKVTGTLNTYLSKLSTLGLAKRGNGTVCLNPEMMEVA